jgi:branched-subunit amino acid transport protein
MNLDGVLIGLSAFLLIGFFHPVVIKAEFHYGTRIWPVFLLAGIITLVVSIFVKNVLGSSILGIFGFSSLWSIRELFEQARRVERGWFPSNPKRIK